MMVPMTLSIRIIGGTMILFALIGFSVLWGMKFKSFQEAMGAIVSVILLHAAGVWLWQKAGSPSRFKNSRNSN